MGQSLVGFVGRCGLVAVLVGRFVCGVVRWSLLVAVDLVSVGWSLCWSVALCVALVDRSWLL